MECSSLSKTLIPSTAQGISYPFSDQAHVWFLEIAFIYASVCVHPPRVLITSGMMWCEIDPV